MKKEKISLFEKIDITEPNFAKKLYSKEKTKCKIKVICVTLAAIGSICGYLYIFGEIDKSSAAHDICGVVWFIGLIAAIIAGSVINFFKVILKVGQLGYHLVPFILLDILGFVFGLAFGLMVAVTLPVIPAAMTLYQSWQNLKDAESYLLEEQLVKPNIQEER